MCLRREWTFVFALWLGAGSPALAQHAQLRWTDVVRESGAAKADLQLIRDTADLLASASPTFAQMLVIVKSASRLILFVRPATIAGDRLGQTQFYVVSEKTFGVMDINTYRLHPLMRMRALAHELAHAVEIACMPWQLDTPGLRSILVDRAKSDGGRGSLSTETRFPSALEVMVLNEYQHTSRPGSGVSALAETHGLSDCGGRVPIGSIGR